MNVRKKLIILVSILAILLGVGPNARAASAQDFYFQSFEADYYLIREDDGTSRLKVKEKLTAIFPMAEQNHGITRIIPRVSDNGRQVNVESWETLNFSAKRNGESEPVAKVEDAGEAFVIYLGDASVYVQGTQVYELEYEFENVILGYAGLAGETTYAPDEIQHEELYWDANGTGWSQQFEQVSARVHYDAAIQSAEYSLDDLQNPSCYVGEYGSKGSEDCLISQIADGYEFRTTRALAAGENLSFDIMFEPDTFVIKQSKNYILVIFTIILAAGLIVVLIISYRKHAKYAEKRRFYKGAPVAPEYTPPRDLSLAEAGILSIKSTNSPEVATLMGLAVAHKIKLVKGEKKALGGYQWEIQCEDIADISQSETQILQILGGGTRAISGETIKLRRQSYSQALQKLSQAFKSDARRSLAAKGLFEAKAASGGALSSFGAAAILYLAIIAFFPIVGLIILPIMDLAEGAFASSFGYVVGEGYLETLIFIMLVLMILVPIVVNVSNAKYKTRTMEGLKRVLELDGLRLYMQMAEAERLKFLQSVEGADTSPQGVVKLYEKLLPYAVLFGIESSWLSELQKYYEMPEVENPGWYSGVGPLVVRDLHDFNAAARSSVSSATTSVSSDSISSSSGSSGFSGGGGGGFSGGGGGGGGGGGW